MAERLGLNLHRRHLSESQRAMVADRLATLPHGGAIYSKNDAQKQASTQAEAAELLNTSRHLSESQRAMVADRLAMLGRGRPEENAQKCAISQAEAAALLNTSRRLVQHARTVRTQGTQELAAAVDQDLLPVTLAATPAWPLKTAAKQSQSWLPRA